MVRAELPIGLVFGLLHFESDVSTNLLVIALEPRDPTYNIEKTLNLLTSVESSKITTLH